MKTRRAMHNGSGFTLMELLVVTCVAAVLVVLILPMLARPRYRNRSGPNCVSNLKQIGLAFRIWEGDNGGKNPMQVSVTNGGAMELAPSRDVAGIFCVMSNELSMPKILICPADKERTAAASFGQGFSDANVSYFLNLDASDAYPQMMLCGDDNLVVNGVRARPGILNLSTNTVIGWTKERHNGAGNIALADGSVQTITSSSLQTAIQSAQQASQSTNPATARFVIP